MFVSSFEGALQGKRLLCGVAYEMEHKIAALRSQLADLGQEHVLAGLSSGDSSQRQSLVDQVSSIDLPLFRRALADVVRTLKGNKNRLVIDLPFRVSCLRILLHWCALSDSLSALH